MARMHIKLPAISLKNDARPVKGIDLTYLLAFCKAMPGIELYKSAMNLNFIPAPRD